MSAKGFRPRRSSSSRRSKSDRPRRSVKPGQQASSQGFELQSFQVGAMPLLNWLFERMRLEEILKRHLPEDDPRTELPTTCALLVLVRNVLLSRQPVYGVGEWAAGFAPDLFDLWRDEVALLHDDRLGGCLQRLFDVLQVVV